MTYRERSRRGFAPGNAERRGARVVCALAALALLALDLGGCRPSSMPPSVGHPLAGEAAPSFQEEAISSREVGIPGSDRTRVTVIDFWASWCVACQETIPVLDELWRDGKRDGVMVIGVSVDEDPDAADAAAQQMGASFPIVVDQRLASRYSVAKIPTTFVIDRTGMVRWVGRDPKEMRRAVEYVLGE